MPLHKTTTLLAALLLAGCDAPPQEAYPSLERASRQNQPHGRWYSYEQVRSGSRLFAANCATCHGQQGQGAAHWRAIGADGKYPPPPLNGTGHAWHHPLNMLFQVIKDGSPGGQGNMPAWKDKLGDDEILATIAWFQSRWPEEVYSAWLRREMQMQAGN